MKIIKYAIQDKNTKQYYTKNTWTDRMTDAVKFNSQAEAVAIKESCQSNHLLTIVEIYQNKSKCKQCLVI